LLLAKASLLLDLPRISLSPGSPGVTIPRPSAGAHARPAQLWGLSVLLQIGGGDGEGEGGVAAGAPLALSRRLEEEGMRLQVLVVLHYTEKLECSSSTLLQSTCVFMLYLDIYF
jgi:hypothetical protein